MSAQQRYPVLPSRMGLIAMKTRLKGAEKGHSLLKKKADALMIQHRKIMRALFNAKLDVINEMRDSHFAVTGAIFAAGDISFSIQESMKIEPYKSSIEVHNVAGVTIPSLLPESGDSSVDSIISGIGKGGAEIKDARLKFRDTLGTLVNIAALQTQWVVLDEAMKVTNRRVNALEKVVIPKVLGSIAFINSELDELEREEFFRLKMVQKKKKAAVAAATALKEAEAASEAASLAAMADGDATDDADMVA